MRSVAAAIIAAMALTAAPARADVFSFSYHLPGFNDTTFIDAAGTLTTTDTATPGTLLITGITGTRTFTLNGIGDVATITGLTPPGSNYAANNNLYSTDPFLDDSGFTFSLSNGPGDDSVGNVNIFFFRGAYQEPLEGTGGGTFSLAAVTVPEPASITLLLGMAATVVGLRRRT